MEETPAEKLGRAQPAAVQLRAMTSRRMQSGVWSVVPLVEGLGCRARRRIHASEDVTSCQSPCTALCGWTVAAFPYMQASLKKSESSILQLEPIYDIGFFETLQIGVALLFCA